MNSRDKIDENQDGFFENYRKIHCFSLIQLCLSLIYIHTATEYIDGYNYP